MKLNTNVWRTDPELDFISRYGFSYSYRFTDLVNPNVQFDQSCIYAVDFNSPLSAVAYVANNSTRYVYGDTPPSTGLMLGSNTGLSTPEGNDSNWTYARRVGYGVTALDSRYRICTKFYFNRLVLAIKIVCSNENDIWNGVKPTIVDYDDYHDNINNVADNNPWIIGITCIPYYGIKGARVKDIETFCPIFYADIPPNPFTDQDNPIYPSGFTTSGSLGFTFGANQDYTRIMDDTYGMFYGIDGKYFGINAIERELTGTTVRIYHPVFLLPTFNVLDFVSHLGMFFTTSETKAINLATDDDNMFLGNIDGGKITGKNTTGSNNNNQQQTKWGDSPTGMYNNNDFNGITNTDPNNYTNKINLNKPNLSTINVFNRTFAVNNNSVTALADFLWNADETKFDEIIKGLGLMGENPMNGLIDLRLYPFDVAVKNDVTTAQSIVIGRTDTGVNGIKLTGNVNALIDLGSCSFFQKFKNFLDYEPYTTAQLYIPYIGVVPVSTAEFMGHNISVKMIVDYITGACTAIVFKDDIPFIYRNGVIGVSIPMTGTDSSSYSNAIISSAVNTVTQGANAAADFAGKNVSGGMSNALGAIGSAYSAFSTPVQYQSAGASSPSVATWQPQNCYFIIDRPVENVPSNYGHTIGYACEEPGTLNSFSGFTVISNPEISFKTTDVEKQMLINMLTGGVFV